MQTADPRALESSSFEIKISVNTEILKECKSAHFHILIYAEGTELCSEIPWRIRSKVSYERAEFMKETGVMETVESTSYNCSRTHTHVHILLDYQVTRIEFLYVPICTLYEHIKIWDNFNLRLVY